MGKRICPECQLDLEDVNIRAHIKGHWDREPHPLQAQEAHRRYHVLRRMLKKPEEEG